jgi:transcription initiation factor TFIIB
MELSLSKKKEGSKTQKLKKTTNNNHLWNIFESEISPNKSVSLECVYRVSGEREYCDVCNDKLSFTDEGFLSCINPKCSIIYKDMLDSSAEWRFYGADDSQSADPTRCGMPINPLLKESSYGCKVLCGSASSYEMRKIKRYTEWQSMPYKEKSHYDEFQRITNMAQKGGISKYIIDDAMIYHKKISDQRSFRGLNRDGIIAASIYISCRINNNPRTAKEIAIMFHLDNTSATKGCKNATSIINTLEKDLEGNEKTSFSETNPLTFISRFCSKLSMTKELIKLCEFIAIQIDKNNYIPENTPHSIAAGIVYFVSFVTNTNITKKNIHDITEISEVTINKCYKKMYNIRSKIVPSVILEKYGHA